MFHRCVGVLVGLAMMGMAGTAHATLIVDGGTGKLLGATDVLVDGILYDVEFVDGSCISIFDGCDADADFDFAVGATAALAAQALLVQVFNDGVDGQFDSDPALTFGCAEGDENECNTLIPFDVADLAAPMSVSVARNNETEAGDAVVPSAAVLRDSDSTTDPETQWARFTPVAVPEPASLALFAIGLVGLGFMTRRRRNRRRQN